MEEDVVCADVIIFSAIQKGTSSNMLIDVYTCYLRISVTERTALHYIMEANERFCADQVIKYKPLSEDDETLLTAILIKT